MLRDYLIHSWYQRKLNLLTFFLLPFSFLFRFIVFWRKFFYILIQKKFPVPIIVVGNLTVGGTGKTPLVIYLAKLLKAQGYRPGIISRAYGANAVNAMEVKADSLPEICGDEPVMMAKQLDCPIVAAKKRVQAAEHLLKHYDCNVLISDDGLQHYALARDIEIVLVDGQRRFGNQQCLPAGPLREALLRLTQVDFVVANGEAQQGEYAMYLSPLEQQLHGLAEPAARLKIADLLGEEVHAVAGIGNPERFFTQLRALGLRVIPHAFPDHHAYQAQDLQFNDDKKILMTEKDAVKCVQFNNKSCWFLPVEAKLPSEFVEIMLKKLSGVCHEKT